jgi:hypothetical protein
MYARVKDGIAVEYPLFEGDLQRRFPELNFPMDMYGTPIPQGYVRVKMYTPNFDNNFDYTEVMPILVNGEYRQEYEAIPLTDEQKQQRLDFVSFKVREKRNDLLAKSDVYLVLDRWNKYTEKQKEDWTNYRQSLRDITTQEGFPYNTVWPDKKFFS